MPPFDPYHKWLGIPPDEQPAGPRRLLGISEDEIDPQVVREAALRQTAFVRPFSMGEHGEHADRILSELADARDSILSGKVESPAKSAVKPTPSPVETIATPLVNVTAKGDRHTPQAEPTPREDPLAFMTEQLAADSSKPSARSGARSGKPIWQQPWATAAGGAVAMLLIMMLFGSGEETQEPAKTNDKQAEQPSDAPSEQQAAEKVSPLQAAAQAARDKAAAEKTIAETTLTFKGHKDQINSVAFSPNGNVIASGSSDNTVKVWNSKTGQEAITLQGHTQLIYMMRFSPDGRQIISASGDNTVKVWDAETGEEIHTFKGHTSGVASATYGPSGHQIASGGYDKTVRLWDAETGKIIETFKGHSQPVRSVAFSPDGKWLVSGSYDKTVKLWDSETGQIIRTLKGHTAEIHSVVFSPDGTRIASGGDDNTLKVWNSNTGQEVLTLRGHSTHVVAVAFSPDGKWLASSSLLPESVVKVWDAETGQETLTLKGHTDHVRSVAFSSDGKRIVSGSRDNTIKIWDLGAVENTGSPTTKSLPASLQQGLVAYYPFNGNANDESGNGHHGEVHGATLASDRVSRKNTAYEFDGVSDYISIIHSKYVDFASHDSFSFSLWVKPTRLENGNAFISKWQSDGTHGYLLRLIDNAGGIEFGEGRAPGSKGIVAEKALILSDWQQIGIVHRNGNADLYRNGLLLARGPSIFSQNEDYITIGRDLTVTGIKEPRRLFAGSIDDIRIYNRALSEAEVKALYEFEKP
jgi:WD40 repeat protein